MTQTQPPKSSSSPTEPDAAQQAAETPPEDPNYAGKFAKGCGWTLMSVVLAVGVYVASKGDVASIGSALAGIVILIMVLGSSGLTGWWHK
jgi:predicted lipid-binding transport protein (Tim44 family)